MIRRFIAWLFGMPLIALRDFDGQETLRLGRRSYFGELYAHRMPFKIRPVWLYPDGVIKPDCYVKKWRMVRDYRRNQIQSGRPYEG